jgi:hypothetical protein
MTKAGVAMGTMHSAIKAGQKPAKVYDPDCPPSTPEALAEFAAMSRKLRKNRRMPSPVVALRVKPDMLDYKRAENKEQRAKTKSKERRAKSKEQRQRAKSEEQRAKSSEQRAKKIYQGKNEGKPWARLTRCCLLSIRNAGKNRA